MKAEQKYPSSLYSRTLVILETFFLKKESFFNRKNIINAKSFGLKGRGEK